MEIILHIGAHRTGSTALERCLSDNAEVLRAEGTAIWGPTRMRSLLNFDKAMSLRAAMRAKDPEATAAWTTLRAAFAQELAAEADAGITKLLISEENMLGTMRSNLLEGRLYANARRNLAAYAALLPHKPVRIGIGIRDYAAYWLSAYAYVISRTHAAPIPDLAELAPALADCRRSWTKVLASVSEVFPQAERFVWRVEELRGRPLEVACQLIGRENGTDGLRPLEKSVNASRLRPADIPAFRALRLAHPDWSLRQLRRALPADPAPRDWFTERETEAMQLRFAFDLLQLADDTGGTRLIGEAAA
ncbi:hypothetical protein [Phaeovulum sp. W22_SRMD_FR3]|uniref:hypothetical protein n=1 Tax=Phaeovulum sp. W22_SRMD_FR3 TaxID=3240274 RepID=UPI003F9D64E8